VNVKDLDTVHFKTIQLVTKFGEIKTQALRVDELVANTLAGGVNIDSVQASTPGGALSVSAEAGFGNIVLGVTPSAINPPEDRWHQSTHTVSAKSNFGTVSVHIREAYEDPLQDETAVNDMHVDTLSLVGDVYANVVDLAEGQKLSLRATAIKGNAEAFVTDKFLGDLSASTFLGKAQVFEKADSESVIVYKTNTRCKKAGDKIREDSDDFNGSIGLHTSFGSAVLTFY